MAGIRTIYRRPDDVGGATVRIVLTPERGGVQVWENDQAREFVRSWVTGGGAMEAAKAAVEGRAYDDGVRMPLEWGDD